MASASGPTFTSIKSDIRQQRFNPVYFLHGEECFFIDEALKLFENVIPEEERDFNMSTLYASQVTMEQIIAACRRFPVMSDRQLVIVKEAQAIGKRELAKLSPYFERPNPQTILVVCMRGAKLESKPVLDALKQGKACVFESKRIYENKVGAFIDNLVKDVGLTIEQKGIDMLTENIGANLAKLSNEIEKLAMILGKGAQITPESIELNVGISKDYNNSELIDSIARRNFVKAVKIVDYFKRNPKPNPSIVTGAALFSFFCNLLVAQFTADKSPGSLMKATGAYNSARLVPYNAALRNYNAWQTIEIISLIRDFDAKVKGNGSRLPEYSLLEELIYGILCAKGNLSY